MKATAVTVALAVLLAACSPPGAAGPEDAEPVRPGTPVTVETHDGGAYRTATPEGGWVRTVRDGHVEAVALLDAAGQPAATIVPLQDRIDVDPDGRPTGIEGPPDDLHAWADRLADAATVEVVARSDGRVTVETDTELVPGGAPGVPSGTARWQLQTLHDGTVLAVVHRPDWPLPPVEAHIEE